MRIRLEAILEIRKPNSAPSGPPIPSVSGQGFCFFRATGSLMPLGAVPGAAKEEDIMPSTANEETDDEE